MKTFIKYILIGAFLAYSPFLWGQQMHNEDIEDLRDANSYFYFEDYEEALPMYLKVLKSQPDNANLQYHIGFCYLNIAGSKVKAIKYLEKACTNLTKNYQEENVYETHAPYDALFYLGNAYLVNNRINQALRTYQKFRELVNSEKKGRWDFDYLEHQEESAHNSVIIQRTPINYLLQNIGNNFNDRFANFNATISSDGKTLAYTTKRKFYNAVYVSRKTSEGNWTTPQNITLDLEVDGNCTTLSLSADGKRLYLFKDENHDGNIFVSKFNGAKWSPMVKLNKNINTQYYETHASESPDGKYLVFASNRKGGFGDLDLYISKATADEGWGTAINLGEVVNTEYNENTPFFSSNSELLFFSSEGHKNIGCYDIFVSQNSNYTNWTTPINLGYPLNTSDDNLFFSPIGDGSTGLYSLFDSTGYGNQDICELHLFIPKFMKGMVLNSELDNHSSNVNNNFKILVIDTISSLGTALVDKRASNMDLPLDPQKPSRLYYGGRSYNIGEKVQFADIQQIEQQILKNQQEIQRRIEQQKHEEELARLESQRIDSINRAMADMAKKQRDSIELSNITNAQIDQSKAIFSDTNESDRNKDSQTTLSNYDNTNYLTELLLLLAPNDAQTILTKVLKKNWQFNQFGTNQKVIEFTNSFKTDEERDAMINTLASLIDYINNFTQVTAVQKSKTISANKNESGFYNFYNRIINHASPELAEILGIVLVNNPQIKTFEEFIETFKTQYPKEYEMYREELLRIMAQQSINFYTSLSDDDKYNLYTSFEHKNISSSTYIYTLLALLIAASVVGLVLIRRKK